MRTHLCLNEWWSVAERQGAQLIGPASCGRTTAAGIPLLVVICLHMGLFSATSTAEDAPGAGEHIYRQRCASRLQDAESLDPG